MRDGLDAPCDVVVRIVAGGDFLRLQERGSRVAHVIVEELVRRVIEE